jgi:FtsH-binding integral membrane protein
LSITVLTSSSGCSTTAVIPKRSALASNERGPGRGRTSFALISAAALFGCFFLRRRIRPGLLALVVLSAVSLGLAGCAGGGGVNTAAATNSSTGNYTITLTGTSGTATTTTSFTLTVQ